MAKYKANIVDPEDRAALVKGVAGLTTAFANWEVHEGKGVRELWSVLGTVYELGARIDQNGLAKSDLVELVCNDPNVQASNKWDPAKKGAHELLLVRLLSLKEETKAKKSQWFSAIRAAKNSRVAPLQSAFVEFLESVGGVDQARKLHAKTAKPKLSFVELLEWARGELDSNVRAVWTPDFFGATPEFPGEVGLILVTGEQAGKKAYPITSIADPAVISRVITWLIKTKRASEARNEKEIEKDYQDRAMAIRKTLRKQYADYKKSRNWKADKPEFIEFVGRVIVDGLLSEQCEQIPDLALRIEFGDAYKLLLKNAPNYIETEGFDPFEIQRRIGFRTRS